MSPDHPRPAVTVALPVFNGAKFLTQAIDSVLTQHGWDIHLVAVDDGSTDASASMLAERAADDQRISVITFPQNRGIAAARNAAISSRHDPLVAMIDQDDMWTPDHLDLLWSPLAANDQLGHAMGHQQFFAPPGPTPTWVRPEWLESPQPGYVFGAWLARRSTWETVGALDEKVRRGVDDLDWFIRARQLGIPGELLPDIVLQRRIHDNNASGIGTGFHSELFGILRRRHQ